MHVAPSRAWLFTTGIQFITEQFLAPLRSKMTLKVWIFCE